VSLAGDPSLCRVRADTLFFDSADRDVDGAAVRVPLRRATTKTIRSALQRLAAGARTCRPEVWSVATAPHTPPTMGNHVDVGTVGPSTDTRRV